MADGFADVVLRLPPAPGRASEVRLPVGRRAFTAHEARAYITDTSLILACLAEAERAYQDGNPVALSVAVRLLRARPDLRWPAWVSRGVLDILEDGTAARGAGRHGDRLTQWLDDCADYTRYRVVELLIRSGGMKTRRRRLRGTTVHDDAAEHLLGLVGQGSAGAIKKAHARVKKRIGRTEPRFPGELFYSPRYYPDIPTLHVLAAVDAWHDED